MLETIELIEAGAGGREQHRVAGRQPNARLDRWLRPACRNGRPERRSPSCLAIFAAAAPINSAARAFARKGSRSTVIVAAFVLAAEDDPQAAVECVDGFERGVDAGGFRIVVIADAVETVRTNSRRCSTGAKVAAAFAICDRSGARAARPSAPPPSRFRSCDGRARRRSRTFSSSALPMRMTSPSSHALLPDACR